MLRDIQKKNKHSNMFTLINEHTQRKIEPNHLVIFRCQLVEFKSAFIFKVIIFYFLFCLKIQGCTFKLSKTSSPLLSKHNVRVLNFFLCWRKRVSIYLCVICVVLSFRICNTTNVLDKFLHISQVFFSILNST